MTFEFRLMFCDLKGAVTNPLLWRILHSAATVTDLPASDVAPRTMTGLPLRQNFSFASENISVILSPPQSLNPERLISSMTKPTTSFRWMKRQSEQSHTCLPRLEPMNLPNFVSSQG